MRGPVVLGSTSEGARRLRGAARALEDVAGRRGHLHWFRYAGADPFSGSSLYACRCGVVRPGL